MDATADRCDLRDDAPAYFPVADLCGTLADPMSDARLRTDLQFLRYVPLNDSGHVFLTLGAEVRMRHEWYDPARFGLSGGRPFAADEQRPLFLSDLHARWFRLFTQFDAVAEQGWPQANPGYHSALDLSHGFFELSPADNTYARFGRQEIDLAGNRLIGVNDPAGIRRAFDGVAAQW